MRIALRTATSNKAMNPSPQIPAPLRLPGAAADVLRKKHSAGGAGYRQAVGPTRNDGATRT